MSDLLIKVLNGVLRVVMAPILVWLVNKNILTTDESLKLVAEIAAYAVPILWAIWAWIQAQREKHTALAMPEGSTPAELKDQVKSGQTASAIASPDQPTQLPVQGDSRP